MRELAEREPQTELLADERTLFLAAFEDSTPIGFVLAHVLPRRHGDPAHLFVYEIGVHDEFRRKGVGTALMQRLAELARENDLSRCIRAHERVERRRDGLLRGDRRRAPERGRRGLGSAPRLVGLGVVLGVAVRRFGVRHRRFFEIVVAVVFPRLGSILLCHESRPSRQLRT